MRWKSTIAWWSTSAPRRTSAGRSKSGLSTPCLNQLTSPPEEKARPAPVTISAAQRRPVGEPARREHQLADHLGAHRVEAVGAVQGQRADLARRSRSRACSAPAGAGMVAVLIGRVSWVGETAGANPNLSFVAQRDRRRGARRWTSSAAGCPISRASTCSRTPTARSSTSARRSRSASASAATSAGKSTRGGGDLVGRGGRRSTSWSPRPRRRRCSPSSSSSSATGRGSTSACATTSRIPTSASASTRSSPASTSPASATAPARLYFGPYSSAKRVRETLDLLGRLFQYRTCEGPEPGRRSGVPCLDYYIKRCGAPCVGYVDREEYRRGIDAIVDFLSGRYRDVERDLERKMAEAAGAEEFERAAVYRDRLDAVRGLMQRRSVAGESLETADLVAVAVEGADANAQVFQVRDGILAERQGFYLANEGERDEAEVTEEFIAQYYTASPGGAAAGRRRPGAARARGRARRGAERAARRPGRGAESPSGARSAACASWRSETRASPWRRTGCARSAAASSGSTRSATSRRRSSSSRCRSGSRGSTSPTSAASTLSPRWSSSRAARRRSPTTAASAMRGDRARGPTTSRRSRRCSAGARRATASRPIAHRTTPSATRASPRRRT